MSQPTRLPETAREISENPQPSGTAQADASNAPAEPVLHAPTRPSAENMKHLIDETRSADPRARATAIAALAEVPRDTAIPALESVIESGEPGTDRQIALQSLHTLALAQGDEDQRIRSVLRGAIYHGDDEDTAQNAQALLEDIESEFAQRAARNEAR